MGTRLGPMKKPKIRQYHLTPQSIYREGDDEKRGIISPSTQTKINEAATSMGSTAKERLKNKRSRDSRSDGTDYDHKLSGRRVKSDQDNALTFIKRLQGEE